MIPEPSRKNRQGDALICRSLKRWQRFRHVEIPEEHSPARLPSASNRQHCVLSRWMEQALNLSASYIPLSSQYEHKQTSERASGFAMEGRLEDSTGCTLREFLSRSSLLCQGP